MSRRTTPTTPFIPPLGSPSGSPNSAPVIPGGTSPSWGPNAPMPPAGGGYPVFNSPYSAPFIPNFTPSPYTGPGVIPGSAPPPSHSRNNSRQGLSADWTGYPQGTPFHSPNAQLPGGPPPLVAPQGYGGYPPAPYPPASYPPGPASAPTSPWSGYPPAASAGYPAFGHGQTPWGAPPPPLPPQATPWGPPQRGLPPQAAGYNTPAYAAHVPLGGAWGAPPPQQNPYAAEPPPWMGAGPGGGGGYFGHEPPRPRAPPEPPSQVLDRMDPFTEGDHYGPVLDPFLVRIVRAQIKINPLIQPLPEDGSEQIHLNWNMLFPTSTIQRSTDPSHISWSKGRDAPATFPRLTELRLVSETIPWMMTIKAQDKLRGVTCGEVIDGIGRDLGQLTKPEDFQSYSPQGRKELTAAYMHNRSRSPGVPGGQLSQGMKRLDFLRKNTMFAGVDGTSERVVKRVCGDVLPCVFVLKCSATYPITKKEAQDQEARMKSHSAYGGDSRAGTRAGRSRASSTNTRISVRPPSDDDDSDGSDSGDLDR